MSARRLSIAGALAAAAIVAGCTPRGAAYPAVWAPLATDRQGCPELAGTWRVREPASVDDGMNALRESDLANPQHLEVHWDVVSIVVDGDGTGIALKFVQQARSGRADAQVLQRHVRTDVARCEAGLAVVERRDGDGGTTTFRLGKDIDGRLVSQRVERRSGEPLLRWGDHTALKLGHSTQVSWSRWEPIPAALFETTAAAAAREAERPAPATEPARALAGSPFGAAPAAIKPPSLPLPAAPATPPGALPLGEAQAIVLGALPERAVFLGMTPTPRGYALRVGGLDATGLTQLVRRLAIDGHFRLQDAAPAAGASAPASAPEPAAGAERTLELVERRAG